MTTNTNNASQVTEKQNTNNSPTDTDTTVEPTNNNFTTEINNIYNHIDNNTITTQIFKSFITKINTTISDYKKQIETYQKTTTNPTQAKPIKSTSPTINIAELISTNELITSFTNIQSRSPKCKLFISFYTNFLTIISQSKHAQDAIKTVINYSNIERIICVPEKNDNIFLYAKLKTKIPLNWRKSSIDCLAFAFEKNNEITELKINNSNTDLPTLINGNIESQFCRIISVLCAINIERHNKQLFRTKLDGNKYVYYIDATIKFDKCSIYPIKSGILITPKPLQFIDVKCIKYYQYSRQGNGLRYFDLDIVLFDNDNDDNSNNNKKKKKKSNVVSLTMIDKTEQGAIDYYFNMMKIKLKQFGEPSPDKKGKNSNSNDGNMSLSDSNNNDDSDDSDDDEEYKIEEDTYEYTDSDSDYNCDDDDNHNINSDSSSDEDDDMDVNMTKKSTPKSLKNKENKNKNSVKKNNKKRKRNEIENNETNNVLNGKGLNKLNIKRFKVGNGHAIGRKTIPNDGNSKKIVSKCVDKKSSKKKNKNSVKKDKKKNGLKINGKKDKNQRSLLDMLGSKNES